MNLKDAQEKKTAPWIDELPESTKTVAVFLDKYPVSIGHRLYVPREPTTDNIAECFTAAYKKGASLVRAGFCEAFNVGMNNGKAAGQTVNYPHIHLIPRRNGDAEDPVGGVRRVIDGQGNYHVAGYINPNTGLASDLEVGTVLPEFASQYEDMIPTLEAGTYPGLIGDNDVDAINSIMKSLPQGNEPVVEIGMFLGKSTREMAKYRTVYTVDYCQMPVSILLKRIDEKGIKVSDEVRRAKSQLEMAKALTEYNENIHFIVDTFDKSFEWPYGNVACAFEDSDHRRHTIELFFDFWWPKLIPGGILCGHDFHMPSVHETIGYYQSKMGLQVARFPGTNMWAIRKPS